MGMVSMNRISRTLARIYIALLENPTLLNHHGLSHTVFSLSAPTPIPSVSYTYVYLSLLQPGVAAAQAASNAIGQQQGVANKIVAWSGVLEWQEVRNSSVYCNAG